MRNSCVWWVPRRSRVHRKQQRFQQQNLDQMAVWDACGGNISLARKSANAYSIFVTHSQSIITKLTDSIETCVRARLSRNPHFQGTGTGPVSNDDSTLSRFVLTLLFELAEWKKNVNRLLPWERGAWWNNCSSLMFSETKTLTIIEETSALLWRKGDELGNGTR